MGKNSPSCSIGITNLGLDNVPKPIGVFPCVKHRQRHGTSEPQRRLHKVYPWTCPTNNTDKGCQHSRPPEEAEGVCKERSTKSESVSDPSPFHSPSPSKSDPRSTRPGAARGGDNNETLTDSSPISKDRSTRISLRVISQEPFRVEFHRIGILGWVVQNLPVHQIESP